MLVESGDLLEVKRHELGCMLQGHILARGSMVWVGRAMQARGDCLMGTDHLHSQHALKPINGV